MLGYIRWLVTTTGPAILIKPRQQHRSQIQCECSLHNSSSLPTQLTISLKKPTEMNCNAKLPFRMCRKYKSDQELFLPDSSCFSYFYFWYANLPVVFFFINHFLTHHATEDNQIYYILKYCKENHKPNSIHFLVKSKRIDSTFNVVTIMWQVTFFI